jgi:hypothetical protein
MILSLLLHDRSDRVDRVDRPEQIHPNDKLEKRWVEVAGLGIHRTAATAARVGDQHITTRPHRSTTRAPIPATAAWSATSTSIPNAVPPDALISAMVLSPVMSRASASNSAAQSMMGGRRRRGK